ncbi:MAG: helix-turn-helix transcriptional regulator, partial [Rickettsiales bacterium]|nr:helix-turn-helix transcriptional regulator [Rickettsiales bacterium]
MGMVIGIEGYKDTNTLIGKRVRRFRQMTGYSLQEVANGIGVSYQQLQKYETGRNRISASMLFEVAQLLNIPVIQFFLADKEENVDDKEVVLLRHFRAITHPELQSVLITNA